MRRAVTVIAVVAAAGCSTGGSGGVHAGVTASTSPIHGGLVATIDRARVLAVCENVRQADTVVQTGLDADAARRFLDAAATLLVRPPVDPAARDAGLAIEADVRAGRTSAAVTAGTTFCSRHAG